MEADRDARIDALFEQALEQPEGRRLDWLAGACGDDESVRSEVEHLLELAGDDVEDVLEPVRAFAAEVAETPEDGIGIGERIGPYTIVGRLGRGGMGVVWLGERSDDTFDRRVAIKVLPSVRTSPESVRRFEQERRILARLNHPHIAHLVDGGVDRRGLPYLVLEHVQGEPVDEYCDRRRLPVEQRIRLVIEIATALQAAHRSLVVHRDIKPSNLLVTTEGDVKLLDFGIAKLLDPELGDAELTAHDGRPMTPTYASPEQVTAEPITTASDVYQLGLLLYELVTGHRPQAARTSSLAELVDLVCRHEPEPPSRAVLEDRGDVDAGRAAALRASSPARLARRFRPDLDAIVARALAKDPDRRYETAAELAAELERFLDGRPVHARRATFGYRAAKWLRRNAALAAAAGVAALLTVGYAVAVTIQARAIDRQRVRAETEAAKAAEVERFMLGLFQSSDPERALGREVTARELLERGTEQVARELAGQPEVQARLWSALGEIHGELGELEQGRRLVRRALEQQLVLPGDHRREIGDSRQRLGILERRLGNWAPARDELEAALVLRRDTEPPDSQALARVLAELGVLESAESHYERAEGFYRESLEIHRRRGSPGGVAVGLNNLAATFAERGDFASAQELLEEALALNRKTYGARHPSVALNLSNIAFYLRRQGRQKEALENLREALAIDREIYGDAHPKVARLLLVEGIALQQMGDLDGAEASYAEALPTLLHGLPAGSALIADARLGLGQLRVRQGRFLEGEELLRESLARHRELFASGSYRTGRVLLWLGRSLAGQGRLEEAVVAWREGLPLMRPVVDADFIDAFHAELAKAGAAGANP